VLALPASVRDDHPAFEEQRLDDRTLSGGSARQQVGIAKLLRYLRALLRDRRPFRNGAADGHSSCHEGTKVATAGASHIKYSQHLGINRPYSG
jgi:hypothetical protein